MRALIATLILALSDAPSQAADDPSTTPRLPSPAAAQVNSAMSIAEPVAAAAAAAPAQDAPEERLLGPRPELAGRGSAATPAAARAAWGIGAGEIVRVVTALAAVVGLLLGARIFLRRLGGTLRGGGRPGGVMNILGRYPLARGQHLLLLRLGAGRVLLVHQSKSAMTTLADVIDPDEVARLVARIEAGAARPAVAGRFQALLGRLAAEDDARQVLDPAAAAGRAGRGRGGRDLEGNEVVDLTRRSRRGPGKAPA